MHRSAEISENYMPNSLALMHEMSSEPRDESSTNVLAAMWRYRWSVLLPSFLGAVIGFVVYLQMPNTYRSTTRLIVESDRSPILDQVTGELLGGIPSIEVVQSQLFSDNVIKSVFRDPRMISFHDLYPLGFAGFAEDVIVDQALVLEPEFTDLKTAQSLVMLLHFDSPSEEMSKVAVKAFSDALQEFYNEKHKASRSNLLGYMVTATDRLYPEMRKMKERYREFRLMAPLQWDGNGRVINPHRDNQMHLVLTRTEIMESMRTAQTEFAAVKAITESTDDPEVALTVIAQLLNKPFLRPDERRSDMADFGAEDSILGKIRIERELVPLMVERTRMLADYGAAHPKVKSISMQVEGLRKELNKIVEGETTRVASLMNSDEQRIKNASQALEGIARGLETQIQMAQTNVNALGEEIAVERQKAVELAVYEIQNEDLLAELESQRSLMDQVQDQMARVELSEERSGTRVLELAAPTQALLVSPILIVNVGVGTLLGMMLGTGLAFMLEKNSNTFRAPEEIVEMVGAPVMTHLPFFKGRLRKKGRKDEINPFETFDSRLAVVHAPASVTAEAIRSCRTAVFFETKGIVGGKVIQLTSPLPGDGKSTIAGNLACSIAQSGKRTVVVDCDLRRPQLSENFAVSDKQGLTDILDGRCELIDALHDTPIELLKVIPSGPIPANPAEALTLPDMGRLLDVLREKFEYVIIDSPPLLLVTDPSILASYCDGVLLAIKVRRKSKPNAKEAAKILSAVGANILGVIVNNSDESGKSDGYRGHGYYRYGRQASRYRRTYGKSGYYSSGTQDGGSPIVVSGRIEHTDSDALVDAVPSNGQPPLADS